MKTYRRILPILICIFFLLGLCGCEQAKTIPALTESGTPPAAASYKTMKLGADGVLEISRPKIENNIGSTPVGEAGTWTIFVYMSGSNLESATYGGTADMNEMCEATIANSADSENSENRENIRFVVQTGGAERWYNDAVSAETLQRHVISNGKRETVAELPLASMGEAATLRNFIKWGVENYPAEKMGLVLWGHGRGSLGGVCKDDLFDNDYLELSEMNSALSEASAVMTDKLEFIGFDACYMGTLETADICASYARYMVASEELEPADGWNYTALGELLAKEPNADWDKISETFCESFLTASEKSEHLSRVTLSVIDLSQIDNLLIRLNDYSRELCGSLMTKEQLHEFRNSLEAGEHFGNSTIFSGYSNRVDLRDFISAGAAFADTHEIERALEGAVIRKSNGGGHPTASGLTVYFPLETDGTESLHTVAGVMQCPFYIELIEKIMLSASPAFDYANMKDGKIASLCVGETGVINNNPLYEHWSDLGEDALGGNISAPVKTAGDFSINSDGRYRFSITPEALRYTRSVGVRVLWKLDYSGEERYASLGTMTCLNSNWENGEFSGTVNGFWIMFPNHEPLAVKPREITENGVIYVSEIRVGKEQKGVTISADNVGRVELRGCWEYGEDGRHTLVAIPEGSTCSPYRDIGTIGEAPDTNTLGARIDFDGAAWVTYDRLQDGVYLCFLEITDIYGNTVRSEIRDFSISNGRITFK